jgi:hypothetical protein
MIEAVGDAAAAVGVGLLAGAAGTAAMTLSSTLEAKLRDRDPSDTPANAVASAIGIAPEDDAAKRRLNNLAHWGYGTGWGAARGLIDVAGLHGAPAAAAHLAIVWGGEQIVLPATGASSPAWKWGAKEIGVDLFHHAVYAAVTSAVFKVLRPGARYRLR